VDDGATPGGDATTSVSAMPDANTGGGAPKRINVAVSPEMLTAIATLVDREKVTVTEAVRRLVMYGDFIYRAVKENGATLIIRDPDNREREILLV
jgi:hypothetical protein